MRLERAEAERSDHDCMGHPEQRCTASSWRWGGLEPANVNAGTVETIRRYGGSMDPNMPWPDDEPANEEEYPYVCSEKVSERTLKQVGKSTNRASALLPHADPPAHSYVLLQSRSS